jgi:predicted aldo/keto reductase-like oxidoreductase
MSYLGEDIPKLGFGLMRLPMLGDEVDLEQMIPMTDLFLEKGFRYFDTAYGYGGGKSEIAAKAALTDRYPRDSFLLATKLPAWAAANEADAKQMFWTSLERTGAGYFDFFLLHNMAGNRAKAFDDYGIWGFLAEQKKKGLIRHLGFSSHDNAAFVDRILTAHPEMEFVQLQINYADWNNPHVDSRNCYETARRHGKPVIIMEPVKGGVLANLPECVAEIFRKADSRVSPASWALRFAASLDGLITVLSGMSTLEQMRDNLATMENFKPLHEEERKVIAEAQEALAKLPYIPCTNCGYCMKGCPQGVRIPSIFGDMNVLLRFHDLQRARVNYRFDTLSGGKASDCIQCGSCEAVCPQKIAVIDELKRAAEKLEEPVQR